MAVNDRLKILTLLAGGMSGVSADLTAYHTDPILKEGTHQHTWRVTVFYEALPFCDGRVPKRQLEEVLKRLPDDDGHLPKHLWSQENIAQGVLQLMPGGRIFGVRVTREEGFETWVWEA